MFTSGLPFSTQTAFNAFKESGDLFNPEYAAKFRELLAKSGAAEGMDVYLKFRGKEPSEERC
jgi:peptidyl-dipeptidase Dcp